MQGCRGASTSVALSATVPTLLLVALFTMPVLDVAAADLPVVHGDDLESAYTLAASRGLFGRFQSDDESYGGQFVDFRRSTEDGSIFGVRYQDLQILDRIGPAPTDAMGQVVGPVAHFENETGHITLHDNRYGWISYAARTREATVHFPSGSEVEVVPDGLKATLQNVTLRLFYHGVGQHNVSMEGSIARIRPQTGFLNYTITLQNGVHGFDTRPGSWWLVARAGGTTVADVLRPTNLQHTLLPSSEADLLLHMAPLDPADRRDSAHRIDSVGVISGPAAAYAVGREERLFQLGNASTIFTGPRAAAWINVTTSVPDVATILLRQPFGLAGNVSVYQDTIRPRILQISAQNVSEFWQIEERPPTLNVVTDEPVAATLRLRADEHVLSINQTRPDSRLKIPLDTLRPDTRYDWQLVVRDRAGNRNATTGTLTTPLDPDLLIPDVQILHPEAGDHFMAGSAVYLNATVTDGAGRILPPEQVVVTLDDRPATRGITWNGPRLTVRLGLLEDGPHEARVTATGYNEERVGSDSVRFSVGISSVTPAPGVAILLLIAGLFAFGMRRP